MADNYIVQSQTLNSATIASDDLSGVHHPYQKMEYGEDGTATPVGTATPLPVTLQTALNGTIDSVSVTAGTNPALSIPVRLTDGTSFYAPGTAVQVTSGTINNTVRTQNRYLGTTLEAAGTTTIFSGSSLLHLITVMGGAAGTIAIYNGTSGTTGTRVANFDSTNALATYGFNREMSTGITVALGTSVKVYVSYGTAT